MASVIGQAQVSKLFSLTINKCVHQPGQLKLLNINLCKTFIDVFIDYHGPANTDSPNIDACCSTTSENGPWHEVEPASTLFSIVDVFPTVKYIKLDCKATEVTSTPEHQPNHANAFQVIMQNSEENFQKRTRSPRVKVGLSRKDELYNDLVTDFNKRGLRLPKGTSQTEGSYITMVLCNALWYITNHHITINEASMKRPAVKSVPSVFQNYVGYDDYKRKKTKCNQLNSVFLESHAQALFSLCMKPTLTRNENFRRLHDEVKALADCLHAYSEFLVTQNQETKARHDMNHPVRSVGTDATVTHRCKATFGVREKFKIIDRTMSSADLNEPVFFSEDCHLSEPFENAMQRHRFMTELQLSVPVDVVRYSPGGSHLTSLVLVRTKEKRTETELQTEAVRLVAKVKDRLPEFHTRQQMKQFKEKLKNVANVQPQIADLIYKELALDASVASHPETQQRLRLIFLGERGLLQDLRKLNAGRPTGTFDVFFEKLGEVVDRVTAEDERRHNIAHLSKWISLKEMIKDAKELCPDHTPIPSASLVRLQFSPRNPYLHSALNFTSRIEVQYKVQRRQLRADHPDDHFCAAQFLYLKHKAIELKEYSALICCDDKAKVPYGRPGVFVSTGVRGKMTLAPTSTTLAALDHDMTSSSLTPSVYLQCAIPPKPDKSFVRGKVTTIINDSVFQTSSPFRHSAALAKIFQHQRVKVLLKFSDGGTDQRNTLEAVKCASICLFKELNLDMLILARCAPGHSWVNPAERVMSILNLGLQNCALQRDATDDDSEKKLTNCGSMASIRKLAAKNPAIKEKWLKAVEPVQSAIKDRFLRLSLKDEPFQVDEPVSEAVITDLKERHLHKLFPELDLSKLRKDHTEKVRSYQTWLLAHCRQRQYTFQIRKCADASCCAPPSTPAALLTWLPDPVLQESGDHYKGYAEVRDVDTTEDDRPSLKLKAVNKLAQNPKPPKKPAAVKRKQPGNDINARADSDVPNEPVPDEAPNDPVSDGPTIPLTAQTARAIVECTECQKPRVVYAKSKLTERQQTQFFLLSEFDYTCGSPVTPPGHKLEAVVFIRRNISCAVPVEVPYYSGALWRMDICCQCANGDATTDTDLKKRFKTVLPLCTTCKERGLTPICHRPFGPKKR